jgi:VWFA-related protein
MRTLFSRSSSLVAALALALATATLVAQTPAGQPPATQTPAPADPAVQRPIFRTFVDLVTTDVIVRDSSGQFVADLTKEEFDVFEDGVKQEVQSVSLVHGGRTFNLQAPPPVPPQEGIILPPARPTNDAAGRIFLFFVDDLHMNFRDTSRIRQLFDKMNKTLLHEGDMFGVVSTGTSSIAIDLTYDRKRMDEAIKKIAGSALKPSELIEGPQGHNCNCELKYLAHVAF